MKAVWVALVCILVAGGAYIYFQEQRIEAQQETIGEQYESIFTLETSVAAQKAALAELRESKKRDDKLVNETADRIDALSGRIMSLDKKTREALRHAPNLTLDSVLPQPAADALCMQWQEAGGRRAANTPRDAPGALTARAADTAAAQCGGWRRMTVRDAVEWNGLLLRHAGLEREDKAALRQWAAQREGL